MNESALGAQRQYSVWNAMVDIVAAPATAIDEIRHRVSWLWWPLVITIVASSGVFAFYYMWVDFPWMVDEMIRATVPPGADPAQAQAMRDFMSPTGQVTMTAIGITIVTMLIYAIQSGYLHLVNKVAGEPSLRFGQWFALSAWTGFLGIFNILAMVVVMVTAGTNQVQVHELAPLSMNALFIHAEPGATWFTWGNSLTLVHLWILALLVLGFARWTGASLAKSTVLVTAPWVLVFGLWAFLIS
ncbi:MAG: YIP1 family protein [Gammaproteobacteria bacterium]